MTKDRLIGSMKGGLKDMVLFGGLGLLALSSSAFAQSYDPIKDFCRRAAHQGLSSTGLWEYSRRCWTIC